MLTITQTLIIVAVILAIVFFATLIVSCFRTFAFSFPDQHPEIMKAQKKEETSRRRT